MFADILLKIAADEFDEDSDHSYYPRPSLAGNERCLRQTVYTAMGKPRAALSGRAVIVFSDSSWHEELTLDLMRRSSYRCHSEQMPVTIPNCFPWLSGKRFCHVCGKEIDKADMHGHIDWIATDLLKQDYLVEHKALSHFGYQSIIDLNMPYDYFTQMAFYMRGLQIDQPKLQRGILLIKNKNQSAYCEIDIVYNTKTDTMLVMSLKQHTGETDNLQIFIKDITKTSIQRFKLVDKHLKAGTLPERQYQYDHWRCQYCAYTEECWSTYIEEFKQMHSGAVFAEDSTLAKLVAQERELQKAESKAKRDRAKVREQITEAMKSNMDRRVFAGEYDVELSATETNKLIKEDLPPEAVKAATKKVPTTRLTIKRLKNDDDA